MPEQCPCTHPELDTDTSLCECGDAMDEHDDEGRCQAEVRDA